MSEDFLGESAGSTFTPPSADVHDAVLCENVDIGMQKSPYTGKMQPKGILMFQVAETNDDGSRKTVWAYYTRTLGSAEKPSNVRGWLKGWRGGKEFMPEELPIDINKFIGKPCRLVLSHKTSAAGKVRAAIDSVLPAKVGMEPLDYTTYAEIQAKREARELANAANASSGPSSQGANPFMQSAIGAGDIPF